MSIWDGLALGAVAALAGAVLGIVAELIKRRGRRGTVRQRIHRLTRALSDASALIDEIESDIRRSQALADRLRADVETYGHLAELKKSEVEALDRMLEIRFTEEGRRSFWTNVALNSFFFAAGVLVSQFLLG